MEIFRNSLVVCCVDNNSARDVAISGSARNANSLLDKLIDVEMCSNSFFWYARVPSPSNVADQPSRFVCAPLENAGVPRIAVSDILDSVLIETCG